jgi:hypothetical protein
MDRVECGIKEENHNPIIFKLAGDKNKLIWEAIMQDKLKKVKELESLILELIRE